MPMFEYRGRNQKGEMVTGTSEAATPNKVADQLLALGIVPVSIRPHAAKISAGAQLRAFGGTTKIKTIDLIFFSRQMYTMLRAGVPIMQALEGLLQSGSNKALTEVIRSLRENLTAGMDLSGALKAHPDVFSQLYVSMIQIGEATGGVDKSFASMAEFLQQEKEIVDKVKGALRYPTIVIIAITIAMFVLNIKVIPAFAGMFQKSNMELPLMTQVLMGTSQFFQSYWYLIAAAMFGAVFGFRAYVRTVPGRLTWDRAKLKLPAVGNIMRWATLARFARTLAITSTAGVPITQALPVVGGAVGNAFVTSRLREMQSRLEQGQAIYKSAEATGLFPPLVLQMLRIGEETGQLEDLINEVAGFYEREVDYQVKNLSSVIEPLLILVIGAMVLVLALGIFMPMWNMVDLARKH